MFDPMLALRVIFALAWLVFGIRGTMTGRRQSKGYDVRFGAFLVLLAGFGGIVQWTGQTVTRACGVVGGLAGIVALVGYFVTGHRRFGMALWMTVVAAVVILVWEVPQAVGV